MKTRYKVLTMILAFVMVFVMVSCNDLVINGSKITKATMTLDFYGADGNVVSSSNVNMYLYENNSPKTVAHIKGLINSGYYNGVCINNVSPYFVELGEYTYDTDGKLTKKDYAYGPVEGEFDKNGFVGQIEPINAGAIVLKRDRGDGSVNLNSGTCGLYLMTMGATDIVESDYCFIGRILQDDGDNGDSGAVNENTNVDEIDRSSYTSFRIIKSLTDYGVKTENQVSTTLYYNSDSGLYYKKVVGVDETVCYKQNAENGEFEEMNDIEQEEFLDLFTQKSGGFDDEYYKYFRVPYQKIVIRSMWISK